jgi:hypothetical protein
MTRPSLTVNDASAPIPQLAPHFGECLVDAVELLFGVTYENEKYVAGDLQLVEYAAGKSYDHP